MACLPPPSGAAVSVAIAISVIARSPIWIIRRVCPIGIRVRRITIAIGVEIAATAPAPPGKQQDQQDQAKHASLGAGFQKPTSARKYSTQLPGGRFRAVSSQ